MKEAIRVLEKSYPNLPDSFLSHKSRFQLLVATILSAQCTDKVVNRVTQDLFRRYPTVSDFANSDLIELESAISQTGFYRNKAKNIKASSKILLDDFKGRVPNSMEDLITLPGVGRKTANIVLTAGFGKVEGIAVDTHVFRISRRLGLTGGKTPEGVEKDLQVAFDRSDWGKVNKLLVHHGREVCKAIKPLCSRCPLMGFCPRVAVVLSI